MTVCSFIPDLGNLAPVFPTGAASLSHGHQDFIPQVNASWIQGNGSDFGYSYHSLIVPTAMPQTRGPSPGVLQLRSIR